MNHGASVALLASCALAQSEVRQLFGNATGDRFGWSVAMVGDLDNDGSDDLAVGAPWNDVGGPDAGRVTVFSGASGLPIRAWNGAAGQKYFGHALAAVGDIDGDGPPDVLVGAASWDGSSSTYPSVPGYAQLRSGATSAVIVRFPAPPNIERFGFSVAGGLDVDGDGTSELLIGAPGDLLAPGYVYVYSGASGALLRRDGQPGVQNLGHAIAVLGDLDGDGIGDYATGAPVALDHGLPPGQEGWVFALSGADGHAIWSQHGSTSIGAQFGWSLARVADLDADGRDDLAVGERMGGGGSVGCPPNPPARLVLVSGATGTVLRAHTALGGACGGYGSAATRIGDLDGDGRDEYAGGEPGWEPGLDASRELRIFGGATGNLLATLPVPVGPANAIAWGFALTSGDATADGLGDIVVGAPFESRAGFEAGAVSIQTVVRAVTVYCASEPNSLGCVPRIAGTGTPSATSPSPFDVGAINVLSHKSGLCFYGFKPRQTNFQGGHLCIVAPTVRTPIQSSGGNASGSDCSGVFSFDFNAHIASGSDPSLVAGEEVFAQYWSRDPAGATTTNLTDALAFYIQ